ncbi:MAG: DUF378 domain-containing protein [Patescibacteria group bacterium]
MHLLYKIAKWLLIIGGINWGLVGLGWLLGGKDWNVVHMIFGSMQTVEALVYLLVGVSAILKIFHCKCGACKNCNCATCGTAPATGSGM